MGPGCVLVGVRYTGYVNVSTMPMAIRISVAANVKVRLMKLTSTTMGRDLLEAVATLRSVNFEVPKGGVVVGLTPTSVRGGNDNCSIPVTLKVVTTSHRESVPLLRRFVVVKRLNLSKDVERVPKTLPVIRLTRGSNLGNYVLPFRSTLRTNRFRKIPICKIEYLRRMLYVLSKTKNYRTVLTKGLQSNINQ